MTKVHRGLSLFALLLGLSGCPDSADVMCTVPLGAESCVNEDACFARFSRMDTAAFLIAGEQAHVIFRRPLTPCESGEHVEPTSATSEASGPEGREIPSEVVFGTVPGLPFLRFSLEQPGNYHFSTVFSPVGGVFQSELHAARDLTAQPPAFELPAYCPSLQRTTQGTWLCYTKVFRGSTQEELFYNTDIAVAGDTVWVVSDTEVRRFVDTGTHLALTDSLSDPDLRAEFLLPSPDELLVVRRAGIVRFSRGQGLVRTVTPAPWETLPVGPQGPPAILLRDGERLMYINRSSLGVPRPLQACPYQLTARGVERTREACQPLPGELVGYAENEVWLAEDFQSSSPHTLHRQVFKGGRLVEEGVLRLSSAAELVLQDLRLAPGMPILRTIRDPGDSLDALHAVATWDAKRQEIMLDALDPGLLLPRASRDFYWGLITPIGDNQTAGIFARSSP